MAWIDHKMSYGMVIQNAQDIRQSYKDYRENYGNLESRNNNRRKICKNPEIYITERNTITITICHRVDNIQSHI